MPLQYMATSEATQRINRHAASQTEGSAELLGTPVGQVVGQMNTRKSASQVVYDFVDEYLDAASRMQAMLEDLEDK